MKEEKNRNITPFVPLSPRLNQHSFKRDRGERKRYLHKCALPVQWKASQLDSRPPRAHVDYKLRKFGLGRNERDVPINCKSCTG